MTAHEARIAVQRILIPPPHLGNFMERTRAHFELLAGAAPDSMWPPPQAVGALSDALARLGAGIVEDARHFLGLTEQVQNTRWDDPRTPGADAAASELRAAMESTGWQVGWAYCIAFCEAIWRRNYALRGNSAESAEIARLLTPSVMDSFTNCERAKRVTRTPVPGAIFFKQLGDTWHGHAGIVVEVSGGQVLTIEGNTSPQAGSVEAEREGDGVFAKHWPLDWSHRSGLWLRGFMNPFVLT